MKHLIGIGALLLFCFTQNSCQFQTKKSQEFVLAHFFGCTGVCQFVIDRSNVTGVVFSEKSNERSLFLLRSLKTSIYAQAIHDRKLIVNGVVEQKRYIDDIAGDPYYKFRLVDWYIIGPFEENLNVYNTPVDDSPREMIVRKRLKPGDFANHRNDISPEELEKLVRTQR